MYWSQLMSHFNLFWYIFKKKTGVDLFFLVLILLLKVSFSLNENILTPKSSKQDSVFATTADHALYKAF